MCLISRWAFFVNLLSLSQLDHISVLTHLSLSLYCWKAGVSRGRYGAVTVAWGHSAQILGGLTNRLCCAA